MGKLSLLHISDIHIGDFLYNDVKDLAISLGEAIEDHNRQVDGVVITGDIFDGKSMDSENNINDAVKFFKQLQKELNKNNPNVVEISDFVFVPGNHDLIRSEEEYTLDKYKKFLMKLYPREHFESNYNRDYQYTIKIFKKHKVAVLGLNSCMIEQQDLIDDETKWLENIDFESVNQKQEIISALRKQKKWSDYGMISKSQLREAFDELNGRLRNPNEYSIVTCFHHHFYPFPEIYDKHGDSSLIRNFTNVIDKLQKNNVKIVLHGHKHLPIIRPVTNQKYLSDPNSMLYVFSAGSIGKKGVTNRSFQIIDIYSPNSSRIAEVHRFNYKHELLETPETFCIPPRRKYEQHDYIMLREVFAEEFNEEYNNYISQIHEFDNISQQYRIDEVIKNISQTITLFDSVKKDIQNSSTHISILLLSIHYRVNALHCMRTSGTNESKSMLKRIKLQFNKIIESEEYKNMMFNMLDSDNNSEFEKHYDDIEKDASKQERTYTAYCTIAMFFTDLYLTLSNYGEFYYKKEVLNANIKLDDDSFHSNIPVTTIKISSDVDRRSSFIQFKCKNPTVHKIAVLIVKEFEKNINKIEDSFKVLGLKIYYLSPRVEKDNYDLENFNFEAYIPTLLPLLTGDNLYKQKEVFIRELLQNSLDAILLREKVDRKNGIDKTIRILFGKNMNPKTGEQRTQIQIVDNGIGMDTFKIERYFTSIGRSFYVSGEFEELQKNEEFKYNPISNFGIGFLSAFMICKEIHVSTKSYDRVKGLEIHIPNFDGCFFINETDNNKTGTTITLYEDERKLLDIKKIIDYIKAIMLDFQLDIEIYDGSLDTKSLIKSNSMKRQCTLPLFLPFTERGMNNISWKDEVKTKTFIEKYNCGLLIDFSSQSVTKSNDIVFLNSGIKLSDSPKKFFKPHTCNLCYNFPSSYLELDVAREKIIRFKNDYFKEEKALELLSIQANELIEYIKSSQTALPLSILDNIYIFFLKNKLKQYHLNSLKEKRYYLSIVTGPDRNVSLKFLPSSEKSFTWVNFDVKAMFHLLMKCLKLFFGEFEKDKKGLSHKIDTLSHRFDKEYSHRFDELLPHQFDDGLINRFEKEIFHGLKKNMPLRDEREFTHEAHVNFAHIFDKFTRKYNKLFSNVLDEGMSLDVDILQCGYKRENLQDFEEQYERHFDMDASLLFDKEFYETFKDELSILSKNKQSRKFNDRVYKAYNKIYQESKDKYQVLLIHLFVTSILLNRRKRMTLNFSELYLKLYSFYLIVSDDISIAQVDKFELNF